MQDFIDLAKKNGVTLLDKGKCQFCGADTQKGVFECVEIFSLGFQEIDFNNPENHIYRFLIVDAHTLQHPELHGRWNNHFHLTRLHLIFQYNIVWTYQHSPKLSDYLNKYKVDKQEEVLSAPPLQNRGAITTTHILENSIDEASCKKKISSWALEVYETWYLHHNTVDVIAKGFLASR